jgi:uncharacterized repeat protein (TIGR03803 family)
MSAYGALTSTALAIAAALAPIAVHAQTLTTLYSFKGGADGLSPQGSLAYNGGMLYGVTHDGGGTGCHPLGCGTVFAVSAATGAETVVVDLVGVKYAGSSALIYQGGKLYGTSLQLPSSGSGGVFDVNIAKGKEHLLYQFAGAPDGVFPVGPLIYHAGIFYGTTESGGTANLGTVFTVNTRTGAEAVLYSFKGGADGSQPVAGLTLVGSTLYGTTPGGGTANRGTVFKVDAATGAEAVLYSFAGAPDAQDPYAGLIFDHGSLYGTTSSGGAATYGTVFKVKVATGTETVLFSFQGGAAGESPNCVLSLQSGNLYGTAVGMENSLPAYYGTIFSVNATTGAESTLYAFTGGADGGAPAGGLMYQGGAFYGTTAEGGASGYGTVYKLTP